MCFFFFRQKTAYEMRISDWSSDVCSSDLEQVRGAALERTLARARGAGAMHVVVALAPARDELRDQFRRILAIGVEDHRRAFADLIEARGERRLLAEVARQPQQRHAPVGGSDLLQPLPGPAAAAVRDIQ